MPLFFLLEKGMTIVSGLLNLMRLESHSDMLLFFALLSTVLPPVICIEL